MILFISTPVFGEEWKVNKDHSEILFQLPYLTFSEVTGRFNEFSGTVFLDKNKHPKEIHLSVKTSSIDTGNRIRDGHLKGSDFFQSKLHPYIIFKSDTISRIRPDTYKVVGKLSVRNITKPFSIEFSTTDGIKDTWGYQNRFAKFKSQIKRSDFNIRWNKTLSDQKYLVGDNVKFWGTFQIQPITGETPSTKHMIPDTKYIRYREKLARGEAVKQETQKRHVDYVQYKPSEKVFMANPEEQTPISVNFKESNLWWASLFTLGLLGFFAVIIIGIYSKTALLDYFPRDYKENGILGFASDLVVIGLVIIYSMAFWILGWGA